MTRILAILALLLAHWPALAAEINVVALTSGKAVVSINGGKIQTLTVGQVSPEGVKLVAANSESASFETDRKIQTLTLGKSIAMGEVHPRAQRATLTADSSGHFITAATLNGVAFRLLVDTGATLVTLSGAEAKRAGINYLAGQKGSLQTANGLVAAYRVKIDTVRVGDITLNNVDGAVVEGNVMGETGLLGLSFLNRLEMRRDGTTMTLTRRF